MAFGDVDVTAATVVDGDEGTDVNVEVVAPEVAGPAADLFFPEQAPTSSTPARIIALTVRRFLNPPAALAVKLDIDLLLGSGGVQAVRNLTEIVRVPKPAVLASLQVCDACATGVRGNAESHNDSGE